MRHAAQPIFAERNVFLTPYSWEELLLFAAINRAVRAGTPRLFRTVTAQGSARDHDYGRRWRLQEAQHN